MKTKQLLAIGFSAAFSACSTEMATSPTAAATTPDPTAPTPFSIQLLVSQGSLGSIHGVQSPASFDVVFRAPTGQMLDILSATMVLSDDGGVELTRQVFGPSAGILLFRPQWDGGTVGRRITISFQTQTSGRVSTNEFTLTL